MARAIASKSPAAVRIGKRAFYEQAEMPLEEAYVFAGRTMAENMMARDAEAGIGAFTRKEVGIGQVPLAGGGRKDQIAVKRRMRRHDRPGKAVVGRNRQPRRAGLVEPRVGGDDGNGGVTLLESLLAAIFFCFS